MTANLIVSHEFDVTAPNFISRIASVSADMGRLGYEYYDDADIIYQSKEHFHRTVRLYFRKTQEKP